MEQFTAKDKDGKEVVYFVRKPRSVDISEAKKYSNTLAMSILNSKTPDGKAGFILREQLEKIALEAGLWTEEDKAKEKGLVDEVVALEKAVHKGGVSKAKGKELALKLVEKRNELSDIRTKLSDLDARTLEAQVDEAYLEQVLVLCILNEDKEPIFSSVEDYNEKIETDAWYVEAIKNFSNVYYGNIDKIINEQTEYKFLLKYKFINEKRQLIDKDGNLVNKEGQRINDKGFLLNEEGHPVNRFGIKVDDEGNPVEPDMEFTDD
jgi:hypothetical protein